MSSKNVEEFVRLGDKASYHYADDTATEWYLGDAMVNSALKLFDESDLVEQMQMRVAAKKFLWVDVFNKSRPEA